MPIAATSIVPPPTAGLISEKTARIPSRGDGVENPEQLPESGVLKQERRIVHAADLIDNPRVVKPGKHKKAGREQKVGNRGSQPNAFPVRPFIDPEDVEPREEVIEPEDEQKRDKNSQEGVIHQPIV
jgi:hypothetical protein